jgi:hypothetical protein
MSVYAPEAPSDEAFAAWETDESDESDEMAEARRERRWTRPQVARPSTFPRPGATAPRPSGGPVTQNQLDSAIALLEARIAAQIKTNSDAIQRVNQHVETVNEERRRLATTAKKEDSSLRREIQQTRETILLLTLLTPRPKTVTVTESVAGLSQGQRVVVDPETDSLTSLLPILLLMGGGGFGGGYSGSSSNGSSGSGGMDQSGLLFAALLLGRR